MKSSQTIKQNADKPAEQHKQDHCLECSNFNGPLTDSTEKNRLDTAFNLLHGIIKTSRDFLIKDKFFVDDFEAQLLGGQKFKRTAVSTLVTGAVYSVLRSDYYIGITNLSYAPTIGLPLPKDAGVGKIYVVKDEAGEAATTTITVRSYEPATIEGALTTTIATNYGIKTFFTNGTTWFAGPS